MKLKKEEIMKSFLYLFTALMVVLMVPALGALHKNASSAEAEQLAERLIKRFEGFESRWYADAGKPAIGYGFRKDRLEGMNIFIRRSLDSDRATAILRKIIKQEHEALRKLKGFESLPPASKAALISMRYNSPALIGPKLRRNLALKDHSKAVLEIAYGHDPKGLYGLVVRRHTEAQYFAQGLDISYPSVPWNMETFKERKAQWK